MTHNNYTLLTLTADKVVAVNEQRLLQVAADTNATAVFGDYEKNGETVRLIAPQSGSVRDDFDFGPVMLVRNDQLAKFPQTDYASFYAMWLDMLGEIVHIPEVITQVTSAPTVQEGEAQFNYVDPRNREAQIVKERIFTEWLQKQGATVPAGQPVDHNGDFVVEATVVIPVKDRVRTILDAVNSALAQQTDFPFNVIIVDNHSTDGTTDALRQKAEADARVVHIIPEPGHGIGGCWNIALDSPQCGRYAVQLDSDDVYSSLDTLQKIVDKFRQTGAACVIGSYTLTDFDLNVIPPGLIDHAEWTDSNGANNALRINGLGAPRAFFTPIARKLRFPDVNYGEDYAMVLRISREYRIARIFESLYNCRRWGGNSDSNLSQDKINANNRYKDWIRTVELNARRKK